MEMSAGLNILGEQRLNSLHAKWQQKNTNCAN